jgi:hypothetical protein
MVKITVNCDKCDGAECSEYVDVCPMEVLIRWKYGYSPK